MRRGFLMSSSLATDLIKEEYTRDQEKENIKLFEKITEGIIDERGEYEGEIDYKGLLLEAMGTVDLIDTTNNTKLAYNVSKTMIHLLLFYLYEKYSHGGSVQYVIKQQKYIYKDKNWDYFNSAEKQLQLGGLSSYRNRLIDKVSRMYAFSKRKTLEVKGEKIKDTISDLCNYMIIYCIWYEKGCRRV